MTKTFYMRAQEIRAKIPKGRFTEVAELSGLDPSWVSRFARGKTQNPGVSTMDKLVEGLRLYRKK
jgi:transcriptional regulator with XRE-family HTH domain